MANRHTTERSWAVAFITLLALAWWIFGTAGTLRLGMVGVGIEDDRITKISPGTPAELAGLRVGDAVVAIEGDEGTVGAGRTLTYSIERDGEVEQIALEAAPWRPARTIHQRLQRLVFPGQSDRWRNVISDDLQHTVDIQIRLRLQMRT